MLCLGILVLEVQNTIVLFEISTLNFVQLQNFAQKKMPKFGTKNATSGSFWAEI